MQKNSAQKEELRVRGTTETEKSGENRNSKSEEEIIGWQKP